MWYKNRRKINKDTIKLNVSGDLRGILIGLT